MKKKPGDQYQIADGNEKDRDTKKWGIIRKTGKKKRNEGAKYHGMKGGEQRKFEQGSREGRARQGEKNTGKKGIDQSEQTKEETISIRSGNCQRIRNLLE